MCIRMVTAAGGSIWYRVRMRPDHDYGNGMGRVYMELGPDIV